MDWELIRFSPGSIGSIGVLFLSDGPVKQDLPFCDLPRPQKSPILNLDF